MPTLPTEQQLAAIEHRWHNLRELAADPTVEADRAANVAEASARDVVPLLAWVRGMQPGYALLGHCRRLLDQIADGRSGLAPAQVAAADLAQRITDEIGHPVTDEPALGPDLSAENARLAAKVDRLTTATAAALERGDHLAAALDRTRSELAAAQSAPDCQRYRLASSPVSADCAAFAGMLMAIASGDSARDLDVEQRVARLAAQITAWVQPCMQPQLAGWLVVALAGANREEETLRAQLADATTGADLVRRSHEELLRWLDSERSAAWRPKAWPVRPLTPEQERSAAADEARTDWPTMISPCDPMIAFDDNAVLLVCESDGSTIVELVPTRRWSALVTAVVKHRCGNLHIAQAGRDTRPEADRG